MVGIAWRRAKLEALIEGPGPVVFGMNGEGPNAGYVSGLQRAKHRILEEAAAEALALPGGRNSKSSQQHDGNRMAGKALGQSLGCVAVLDLANHKGIVTGDLFISQGNVGL